MTKLLNEHGLEMNGTQGPWWVKTLWVAGPITLIALGLVYLNAIDLRRDVNANAQTARAIFEALASHQRETETLHRNIEEYMRVQNLLTRQLCANAAKTDAQMAACFRP